MNVLFHLLPLSHANRYVNQCTEPQHNGFICSEDSCHPYTLSGQSAKEYNTSQPSMVAHIYTRYEHAYANTHIIKSNAIQSGVLQSQ